MIQQANNVKWKTIKREKESMGLQEMRKREKGE